MKKATNKQVLEVAAKYDCIGLDYTTGFFAMQNGERVRFGRMLWRNQLHNLACEGLLKYNGDGTYSAV